MRLVQVLKEPALLLSIIGGMSTRLNVDYVFEVPTTQDERDPLHPKSDRVTDRGYVRSIGKAQNHITLLLDCEKLLNEVELETVSAQL